MNAQEKLIELRAERCRLHDRIDELVLEIRGDEANYQQRQAARQQEVDQAAARIGEIKNASAALESVNAPQSGTQAVAA